MSIKEVATSEDHRHSGFAQRVLEDELALWACSLFQFERLIANRGGTVRPRVEFSKKKQEIDRWQAEMCRRFEAEQPAPPPPEMGMNEEFFNTLGDMDFFA